MRQPIPVMRGRASDTAFDGAVAWFRGSVVVVIDRVSGWPGRHAGPVMVGRVALSIDGSDETRISQEDLPGLGTLPTSRR